MIPMIIVHDLIMRFRLGLIYIYRSCTSHVEYHPSHVNTESLKYSIHWQSRNTANLLPLPSHSCSVHGLMGIHSNTKTSAHRAAPIDKNSPGFRMRSSASIWSQKCGRSCMRWTSSPLHGSTAGRDSRVLSSLCPRR